MSTGDSQSDFHDLLIRCARDEGFPLAGALDLDLAGDAYPEHLRRYDEWLAAGHAGAMSYLERGRDRRADPRLVFPEAQSVLCVAIPYPRRPAGAGSAAEGPRYARYLQGADYHEELAARLERALGRAAAELGRTGAEPLRWKTCVDTSAVLERSWAALAGLGWIGKNTLLIHPKLGSYLFLGEALLNRATGRGPAPLADYCGNCARCLDACPTGALTKPHHLDSTRCISYWTLEKRGELPISEEGKRAIGPWIAGCDLCQEACPFNFKPARAPEADPPPNATDLAAWRDLLLEDEASYKARVKDSALNRVKPAQFRRNLAIALANAIAETRTERSRWETLRPLIHSRLDAEPEPAARSEWERCLRYLS